MVISGRSSTSYGCSWRAIKATWSLSKRGTDHHNEAYKHPKPYAGDVIRKAKAAMDS